MSKKPYRFTAEEAYMIFLDNNRDEAVLNYMDAFRAGIAFAKIDTWGRMEMAIRKARQKYGVHNLSEVALRKIVLGGK